MSKLFSASLFALGIVCAAPAAANTVPGGSLYIQDTSKDIVLTFGGLDGKLQSFSNDSFAVFVGTIDADGKFVDNFTQLFYTQGSDSGIATLVPGSSLLPIVGNSFDHSFIYNASAGAVELVFMWHNFDSNKTFTSEALLTNPSSVYTQVTYNSTSNQAQIGMEGFNGGPLGWSDVIVSASNVGVTSPYLTTPAIPEPETYAMMLAGLGVMGAVVRRRRNSVK